MPFVSARRNLGSCRTLWLAVCCASLAACGGRTTELLPGGGAGGGVGPAGGTGTGGASPGRAGAGSLGSSGMSGTGGSGGQAAAGGAGRGQSGTGGRGGSAAQGGSVGQGGSIAQGGSGGQSGAQGGMGLGGAGSWGTGGMPSPSCSQTYVDCDGDGVCETNLHASLEHCGACDNRCELAHAEPACYWGLCHLKLCHAGWYDCDRTTQNGCESPDPCPPRPCPPGTADCTQPGRCTINILGHTDHCGRCNNRCVFPNAKPVCVDGVCKLDSCEAGFSNCDGHEPNGCETQGMCPGGMGGSGAPGPCPPPLQCHSGWGHYCGLPPLPGQPPALPPPCGSPSCLHDSKCVGGLCIQACTP
ncbi:MAG: hypothetical protein MJD61_05485 [Proteobacteria bacterium]|nr:hypothetical protein [Pseudomonadota bacterium]